MIELVPMAKGSINSIFNRPRTSPRNPFASFGDKAQCTHYDITYRKEGDPKTYGPLAVGEVEGVEPVRVFCRNRRSRALANGFLCDHHSAVLFTRPKGKHVPDFMKDPKDVAAEDRRYIDSHPIGRVRLITAGKDSVYLRYVE